MIAEVDHRQHAGLLTDFKYHQHFENLLLRLYEIQHTNNLLKDNSLFKTPTPPAVTSRLDTKYSLPTKNNSTNTTSTDEKNTTIITAIDEQNTTNTTPADAKTTANTTATDEKNTANINKDKTVMATDAPISFLEKTKLAQLSTALAKNAWQVAREASVDAAGKRYHAVTHPTDGTFNLYNKKIVAETKNENLFSAMLKSFYTLHSRDGKFQPKITVYNETVRTLWITVLKKMQHSDEEIRKILPQIASTKKAAPPIKHTEERPAQRNMPH